jgi:ATP-binding cassette subfamily F protein 3
VQTAWNLFQFTYLKEPMFFIQFIDVSKAFSEQKPLIKKLNITISESKIIGIIGRNGEGKTTLLKMLTGEVIPDSGQIVFSQNDLSIGYHTQFLDLSVSDEITIEDYILSNFGKLNELNAEINTLVEQSDSKSIERLIQLQGQFEELGGYRILADIDTALIKLGLTKFKSTDFVKNLSGGQKTRLQLAKVLIQNPDILLLDEPTNHLDTGTIEWLTDFIKRRKGITVIVSHDRNFLNQTVNHILEIERGDTKLYTGNYDEFIRQKEELIAGNLEDIKQSTRKIVKLKAAAHAKASLAIKQHYQRADKKTYGRHSKTIMRNKAGKKMRSVKMMQKRIDNKIEVNTAIAPKKFRNMDFSIQSVGSGGDFVLRTIDLDISIANKVLVKDVNLEVMRGERVAIIGENGTGKTTLLRTLIDGIIKQDLETIKVGGNIRFGYYSQEHEGINISLTAIDDFRETIKMTEADAANYLHRLLFTYEQLRQKVSDLSQGEKSKLALAKLLAQEHNFLILDEPTNHLDIASREVLEEALNNYEGTLLIVSHDKYFLEKIGVMKKYLIEDGKIEVAN